MAEPLSEKLTPVPCPTCGSTIHGSDANKLAFANGDPNAVGELLRSLTFTGDGFGCYTTFDVRDDAEKWDYAKRKRFWRMAGYDETDGDWDEADDCARMGEGCNFMLGAIRIDCCWYWDGDGILVYVLSDYGGAFRWLVNSDCKKDYRWNDDTPPLEDAAA